ncbi:MAG: type IX secretion system membrane protein PorP/SprF [Saprospiraceae bacterium]
MKKIFFLLIQFCAVGIYAQQEAQYTHFAFNRMAYNPAYAGSKSDLVLGGIYRHQWFNLPTAPHSANIWAHKAFMKDKVGAGISIQRDQLGLTENYNATLNYAYRMKVANGNLSVGIRAEGEYNRFDWSKADPADIVDNSIGNYNARMAPNFGAGLYYQSKSIFFGLSAPRFFKNALYSKKPNGRDQRTYFGMAGALIALNQQVKFSPSILFTYNKSAPTAIDFNANLIILNKIWVGGSYRTTDSFDALLQYQANPATRVGIAYDFTTSSIRKNTTGSIEVMMEYTFCGCANEKVKNIRFF